MFERKFGIFVEAKGDMKSSPIVDHVNVNRGQGKKKCKAESSAAEQRLHYEEWSISGKR